MRGRSFSNLTATTHGQSRLPDSVLQTLSIATAPWERSQSRKLHFRPNDVSLASRSSRRAVQRGNCAFMSVEDSGKVVQHYDDIQRAGH